MAVFIVLWSCSFTTKLRSVIRHNLGHSKVGEDLMFVVLACDGIWDVLGNQEVADFVISKMATGMEPAIICEELMTRCLAPDSSMGGLGCDNMTVILVCFLHNKTYDK